MEEKNLLWNQIWHFFKKSFSYFVEPFITYRSLWCWANDTKKLRKILKRGAELVDPENVHYGESVLQALNHNWSVVTKQQLT